MATQTYAIPNAGLIFSGGYGDSAVGGHNARAILGSSGTLDLVATGTQLEIQIYTTNATTPFQISVDGGAFADLANAPANTWNWVTVFTGLGDAAHTATIRRKTGDVYFDRDDCVRVTGGAPAISAPAGFGTQYQLRGTLGSYILMETGWVAAVNSGVNDYIAGASVGGDYPWSDVSIRFRATIETLKLWTYRKAGKVLLYIDGVAQSVITFSNLSLWGWETIATGLDSTTEHEYTIYFVKPNTSSYHLVAWLMGSEGRGST